MISVTAAIIEENGLILAARRKPGGHLAGYWEFPGGKIEEGETGEECLAREIREEFGVACVVGNFFAESTYDYGSKIIRLLAYHVHHLGGSLQCRDHDQVTWLSVQELSSLQWAPADIPLVEKLQEEYLINQTLAYYRYNAKEYVQETLTLNLSDHPRQRFLNLLGPNCLILDLGCGSGRDSRFFLDQGHRIKAVDAVEEIAARAEKYLGQAVYVQKAEELDDIEIYQGIWASASLLHIPRSRIGEVFRRIIIALKPAGIWYMSFKLGETEDQDQKQRFFNNYSVPLMHQLLGQFPQVKIIDISESSSLLRGEKQRWLNVFVIKK